MSQLPDSMGPDGVEEGNDSVHTKVKQKKMQLMCTVYEVCIIRIHISLEILWKLWFPHGKHTYN